MGNDITAIVQYVHVREPKCHNAGKVFEKAWIISHSVCEMD